MVARPYWITPRLAIVPRPRGQGWLDDEMVALRDAGIDVVVSMLEAPEATDLGLLREEAAAKAAGLLFFNFPITDHGVPTDIDQFERFLRALELNLVANRRIGIHRQACIGRSSVTAASLLIRSGTPAAEAWRKIQSARGFAVPDTMEQRDWVERHIGPRAR